MDDDRNISITYCYNKDDHDKFYAHIIHDMEDNNLVLTPYETIEELNQTLSDNDKEIFFVLPKGFCPKFADCEHILIKVFEEHPKIGLVFADFSYNGVDFHCSARYSNGIGFIPFIIKSGLNVSFNGNVGELVEQIKRSIIVHSIPEVMFEYNEQ